jgi:predicted DNA-binding transcriptional regulator YafY
VQPLDLIAQEARANQTVLLDAYEKDGSRETREIEPYSLRPGAEQPRLMFFCLKRGGMRSILLGNIVSAQATGRPFEPRFTVEF